MTILFILPVAGRKVCIIWISMQLTHIVVIQKLYSWQQFEPVTAVNNHTFNFLNIFVVLFFVETSNTTEDLRFKVKSFSSSTEIKIGIEKLTPTLTPVFLNISCWRWTDQTEFVDNIMRRLHRLRKSYVSTYTSKVLNNA